MKTARDFFELVVRETVEEFLQDPTNVRRGLLASIVLHHLADYRKEETGLDQSDLVARCPEFTLIRDVSNAAKHMKRRNEPYLIAKSEQIKATPRYSVFRAPFGQANFATKAEVWMTLDNGEEVRLRPIVEAVMQMWQRIYA